MKRGRLLAVSGVPPWPLEGGFSLRTAHLLERLSADWKISLVLTVSGAAAETALDPAKGHETLEVPMPGPWAPRPRRRTNVSVLRRRVEDLVETRRPDALLLFTGMEFLAAGRPPGLRALGDRVDCGVLERVRYLRHARFPRQVGAALEALAQARYERWIVRVLDATVVAGEDDRRALARLSGRDTIHVVPNGVGTDAVPDFDREAPQPTVAFTGTLSYYANSDAAVYFVRKVWPRVHRRCPDARCLIAGRRPSRRVAACVEVPGVEVRADVSDMPGLLRESWLAVAPMRSGVGVKNKVLEAWAVARPVVMTPIAANGLDLDPAASELIASRPDALADLIVELFEDPDRRRRLGAAAHRLVRERHSWEGSAGEMSRLLTG